jgi:hypothetical protein
VKDIKFICCVEFGFEYRIVEEFTKDNIFKFMCESYSDECGYIIE